MQCFMVGQVLEPEVVKGRDKSRVSFGLLSGKASTEFTVFEDDGCFAKAANCKAGQTVCAIVSPAVDKQGKLRMYLRDIAPVPADLRGQLVASFKS